MAYAGIDKHSDTWAAIMRWVAETEKEHTQVCNQKGCSERDADFSRGALAAMSALRNLTQEEKPVSYGDIELFGGG